MQCLELEGYPGPRTQRERNLLNILTALREATPIRDSLQVLDKSQSFGRTSQTGIFKGEESKGESGGVR